MKLEVSPPARDCARARQLVEERPVEERHECHAAWPDDPPELTCPRGMSFRREMREDAEGQDGVGHRGAEYGRGERCDRTWHSRLQACC